MARWQVQEAKSRFSELLDEADRSGPQLITRHGAERAVVLSIEEYKKLTEPKRVEPELNFRDHLLNMPKVNIKIRRSRDTGRRIDL